MPTPIGEASKRNERRPRQRTLPLRASITGRPRTIDPLDQDWRAKAKNGGGPLIDQILAHSALAVLKQNKAQPLGMVTDRFVLDNRRPNVAQSDVTADAMQDDEPNGPKIYSEGPDARFIDEIAFDHSIAPLQCQPSAPITEPATGLPIGAMTFGLEHRSDVLTRRGPLISPAGGSSR